jgi:hypothetical protein
MVLITKTRLYPLNQIGHSNLEGVGYELKGLDRNIRFPAFYLAHMRTVESGAFCEDVLRPFPFQPQCTNIRPDPFLNVLHIKQCRSSLPKTILVITSVLFFGGRTLAVPESALFREYAALLRLLSEKVYTARLSTGQAVRDTTDFNKWLGELAERAEAKAEDALEQFFDDSRL